MSTNSLKLHNRREFLKVASGAAAGTCLSFIRNRSFLLSEIIEEERNPAGKQRLLHGLLLLPEVQRVRRLYRHADQQPATARGDGQTLEHEGRTDQLPRLQDAHRALFNCSAKQCAEKKGVLTCAHCAEFPRLYGRPLDQMAGVEAQGGGDEEGAAKRNISKSE